MAFAYVQEFDTGGDRSTTNYDAVSAEMDIASDPPPGLIHHSVGFTEDGTFRIYDVWDSREHAEHYEKERLGPALERMMANREQPLPAEPSVESYELHDDFTAG